MSAMHTIHGPGGTGKTLLYQCLLNSCEILEFDVVSVAWTGIAAMLLPNGRIYSIHSKFKLPLNLHEQFSIWFESW